jgi:hypothetical protein
MKWPCKRRPWPVHISAHRPNTFERCWECGLLQRTWCESAGTREDESGCHSKCNTVIPHRTPVMTQTDVPTTTTPVACGFALGRPFYELPGGLASRHSVGDATSSLTEAREIRSEDDVWCHIPHDVSRNQTPFLESSLVRKSFEGPVPCMRVTWIGEKKPHQTREP